MPTKTIRHNYLYFYDFVGPKLRRRALFFAHDCEFSADELLATVSDKFSCKFRYLSDGQAVKYAGLLLLQAARDAGYRHRKDKKGKYYQYISIDDVELAAQHDDTWRWRESRLALVDRALASGQVKPVLAAAIALIAAGYTQRAAAAQVGMSPTRLSQGLAELGRQLTGQLVVRNKRRGCL